MSNVFLKPKDPAAILRDPVTMLPLAAEGEWKSLNQFWQRRIRDGEVIAVADPDATEAPGVKPKRRRRVKADT